MDVCRFYGICDAKDVRHRYVFDIKSVPVPIRKGDKMTLFGFGEASDIDYGEIKVSEGIITGLRSSHDPKSLTTNAIINKGYIGGPAINDNFNFIGINVSCVIGSI